MYYKRTQNSTSDFDLEAPADPKPQGPVASLPGIQVKAQRVADRYRSLSPVSRGNSLRSSVNVQQRFKKLHELGPRAGLEFVLEVSEKGLRGEDLLDSLDKYCRLDLRSLQAVGGDKFPAPPLHAVSGGTAR